MRNYAKIGLGRNEARERGAKEMAGLKERALAQSAKVMVPMLFSERNFGTLLYQVARRVGPKVELSVSLPKPMALRRALWRVD